MGTTNVCTSSCKPRSVPAAASTNEWSIFCRIWLMHLMWQCSFDSGCTILCELWLSCSTDDWKPTRICEPNGDHCSTVNSQHNSLQLHADPANLGKYIETGLEGCAILEIHTQRQQRLHSLFFSCPNVQYANASTHH